MMQKYALYALLASIALVVVPVASSTCTSYPVDSIIEPIYWEFGLQDSKDGSMPYSGVLSYGWFQDDIPYMYTNAGIHGIAFIYWINNVLLTGAKNLTSYDNSRVPTANFTCTSDNSGIWGPAYPDLRYYDMDIRAQYNLEAYVHSSAPNQTSYVRSILFVKNIGSTTERVRTNGDWYLNPSFVADVSFISNEGRYLAMWPWQNGDLGEFGTDPSATYTEYQPMALHGRGPKARNNVNIVHNMASALVAPLHYAELQPGQEMAIMFISTYGTNKTVMLKNAAEIDTEPAHIFHDLNADQLSLIRNWGGCEVILAPEVDVTVAPPTQCSSGLTSDFTVSATTQRTDFTTGFTHRVVHPSGNQLVAAQSSNTISVPNNVGQVMHQLWYKECLVKETPFTSCNKYVPPPVAAPVTQSAPVATPTGNGKAADASSTSLNIAVISFVAVLSSMMNSKSMTFSLVVVCALSLFMNGASATPYCLNIPSDSYDSPMRWEFGMNDGNGVPAYTGYLSNYWKTVYDLYSYIDNGDFQNAFTYWINGIPIIGGKNYSTGVASFVQTANFTCDSSYSGLWGPAYPDYRESDQNVRGQYQDLEVYMHYSAPNDTSYIRGILFIKNVGNAPERVNLFGDWTTNHYTNDISPMNGGRYYTAFPWREGDLGRLGDNPAATYSAVVTSIHAAGPKARESDKSLICAEYDDKLVGVTYYTTLAAGQEMALMYITSFGVNKTLALKNAAEIDTEPAFIFHGLNADQLSLIRNWGACQSVLAPEVDVKVTSPTQCSSGLTSDFTVSATTQRTDFTTDFTHRVISSLTSIEVVPAQSSTTLSVANDIGPVTHQLWYKECLIKETSFTSCTTASNKV